MSTLLSWLLIVSILISLWYAVAYLVALRRLRARALLLPALQWLLVGLGLLYLARSDGAPNLLLAVAPLLAALGLAWAWRRSPSGLALVLRSYPRGTLDLLTLRRPVYDLKRRVRTK